MTTNIEKPQEKIEFYCREPVNWADSAVRAGAFSGIRGGVIFTLIFIIFNYISLGRAIIAIAVAIVAAAIASIFPVFGAVAVAAVAVIVVVAIGGGPDSILSLSIFLIGLLLCSVLGGLLSYAIVRFCYADVVVRVRVSSKFIVYTDAKGEQFFISAARARDVTVAMQECPDLKIIETGGVRGLNIISGKLEDFPGDKKILDDAVIAKGENLAVQWQAIKEAMAKLAKEGGGTSGGKHGNTFIHEALEIAGFAKKDIEKQAQLKA